MSVTPSPIGGFAAQFFDNNGQPLSGGKIYTYSAGTTTPQASYTSALGVTPHANPIVLDSAGRVPGGEIWLTDSLIYKFVIETSTAVLIGTYDNITGINSNFVNYTVQEEVQTATAGQTVFNLATINYTPGTNSLTVYVDGVNQYVGDSYLETDSTTVTFTSGLHVGAEVKFTTAIQTTTGAVDASIVSYTAGFLGATQQTVQTKLEQYVSVKDFGAVGDGVADDTGAINDCATYCAANGKTMSIPAGVYKITGTISASCSISGDSPYTTIIKNYGIDDALDLSGAPYYTTFENFAVDGSGNAASRDGISLYNTATSSGNTAYCHFFNVYSYNNGRHGLYHRYAWATRYSQCKFHYNGGLGVFINTVIPGDIGGANAVTFFQCDARHNGGTTSGFGGDAGGIKIQGASVVSWIGGVIESNNGYGVYVGDAPSGAATRLVQIKQTYFEYNGYNVAIGGLLYATGPWANVVVEDCWLAYGADAGNTNTCFYITDSLDDGNFVEKNNTYVVVGTGTSAKYGGNHFSGPKPAVGTAPTVYAYQDAATTLTVPNQTFTKVIFDQVSWDTNANYNLTTGRFTPTVAGYYRISARMNGFPTGATAFWLSVFVNGAENYRGQQLNTSDIGAVVDTLKYANGSTDYFEIFVYQDSGATQSYTPGFNQCSLQIEYVRNT